MKKGPLRLEQEKFAKALAHFKVWLDEQSICYTMGDAFRDPRVFGEMGISKGYGHRNSCHKLKLAQDFNFENDADHFRAHDKWDTMGGAKRIPHDMNHYSFEWRGNK